MEGWLEERRGERLEERMGWKNRRKGGMEEWKKGWDGRMEERVG